MKDMRGNHSLAVRNAIYKEFGLSSSIKRKTINDVSEWKKSPKVKESYEMLYNSDFNLIENITKIAFPSLTRDDDETFENFYCYTASICDIVLNPDFPGMDINRKPLERRFKRFMVLLINESIFLFLLIKTKIIN